MQTRLHSWRTVMVGAVLGLATLAGTEASAPAHGDTKVLASNSTARADHAMSIPAWALQPENFPPGLKGTNNCTFRFGQNVPQWNFHEDAGCWERNAPDGWTRQQQHRIHVPALVECNGGPADLSPIRICRAPGLENPCPINPTTGPNGCALCVRSFNCH